MTQQNTSILVRLIGLVRNHRLVSFNKESTLLLVGSAKPRLPEDTKVEVVGCLYFVGKSNKPRLKVTSFKQI